MHRRRLLAVAAPGAAALLAGCSNGGDDGTPDPDPLDGEWILRGRIANEDDQPREWRVESRSQDRESVAAAWATVPAGGSWEFELRGRLFDERREVYAESDGGAVSEPWRPVECRRLLVTVTITGGNPRLETACRAA